MRGTQFEALLSFGLASPPVPSFSLAYLAGASFSTAVPFASLKVAFLPVTHDSLFALRLRVNIALG